MKPSDSGQILTAPRRPPGSPKNPLSDGARWKLRHRTRKRLLRQIDGPPNERQLALIEQILKLTWEERVAGILIDQAAAAGDTDKVLLLMRQGDRHRAARIRLDKAFAAACRRPPPPKPRTIAEAMAFVAARKREQ